MNDTYEVSGTHPIKGHIVSRYISLAALGFEIANLIDQGYVIEGVIAE